MTVLEAIQKSADFLTRKGVESPRLQAELLLGHALAIPRMQLYLQFDRALTPAQTDQLRGFVTRRGNREPLQHIVGTVSFCGHELRVGPAALIPRSETEQLAELAWTFLKSISGQPARALDFGTGTGCLAIAVAAACPESSVVAIDVSRETLELAQENSRQIKVSDRIEFLCINGFVFRPEAPFDLIVTNPPYIPSPEIPALDPEVRDFDPHTALDGGQDGLHFYRHLAHQAAEWLLPGGKLMAEFGDGQAPALKKLFEEEKWIVEAIEPDYSRRPRFLVASRAIPPT